MGSPLVTCCGEAYCRGECNEDLILNKFFQMAAAGSNPSLASENLAAFHAERTLTELLNLALGTPEVGDFADMTSLIDHA